MKDRGKDYGEAIKLEESERIRQNCIHFLELQKSHHAATFEIDECIAWLEKQRDIDKLIKELGKYKVKYTQEVLEKHINSMSDKNDERIRKELIRAFESLNTIKIWNGIERIAILDWLKKQGEQKPTDKVSPKFKIGDWIVYNRTDYSREIMQIYDIRDNRYYFTDNIHFSWSIKECDEKSHLWSLQDAKNGDILVHNGCTFIFMGIKDGIVQTIEENMLELVSFGEPDKDSDYHPATKEQRHILFQKMHEAGFE